MEGPKFSGGVEMEENRENGGNCKKKIIKTLILELLLLFWFDDFVSIEFLKIIHTFF